MCNLGAILGLASTVVQTQAAVQKRKSEKAMYAAKVQAQNESYRRAAASRDMAHQDDIRQADSENRKAVKSQIASAAEAERLRGKSGAQRAGLGVSSTVFDFTLAQIDRLELVNQSSNLWNQKDAALDLARRGQAAYATEEHRRASSAAGIAPSSSLGLGIASSVFSGASTALSGAAAYKAGGLEGSWFGNGGAIYDTA